MSKLVLLVLAAVAVFVLAVMLVLAAMTPDTVDIHHASAPSCHEQSTLA